MTNYINASFLLTSYRPKIPVDLQRETPSFPVRESRRERKWLKKYSYSIGLYIGTKGEYERFRFQTSLEVPRLHPNLHANKQASSVTMNEMRDKTIYEMGNTQWGEHEKQCEMKGIQSAWKKWDYLFSDTAKFNNIKE
jgi:hypothetical protein